MKLRIYDTKGAELIPGDMVRVTRSGNNGLHFYTQIQVVDGRIFPLYGFAYDIIVKVDAVPADAVPCTNDRTMWPCDVWAEHHGEVVNHESELWQWFMESRDIGEGRRFYRVELETA